MRRSVRITISMLEKIDPAAQFDQASWARSSEGYEVFNQIRRAAQRNGIAVREQNSGITTTRVQRSHRPRATVGMTLAAALLLVALAATIANSNILGWQSNPAELGGEAPFASAEQVLRLASVNAANRTSLTPDPGEYIYRKVLSADLLTAAETDIQEGSLRPAWSSVVHTTSEMWLASDGSGQIRRARQGVGFLGPRDRERCFAADSVDCANGPQPPSRAVDLAPGGSYARAPLDGGMPIADAPTDPDLLETLVQRAASGFANPPDQMFVVIADLLRSPLASPQLQSALYEVAARIPGVQLVGEVEDPLGRWGTAVTLSTYGQTTPAPDAEPPTRREELIFDPQTGQVLSERTVALVDLDFVDAGPGDMIGYEAFIDQEIVQDIGQRP